MLSEYNVKDEDIQKFLPYLTKVELKKGEVFIFEGRQNEKLGLLQSGLMISTYISEKGNEEVSRIYSHENEFTVVSNHESFYYGTLSTENIIAIEDTTLMVVTKEALAEILKRYPELEKVVKDISEKSYVIAIRRIKHFQSFSGKERIRDLYTKHKGLFLRVKKRHLASFLGINRNDFTKFLKEIMKEY